jgi:hypothetical protein
MVSRVGAKIETFKRLKFKKNSVSECRSRKHVLGQWKRMGIPGPDPDFWMGNAKQLTYGRVVGN